MNWCNTKKEFDYNRENFVKIVANLVLECPSSIKKSNNGETVYADVSVRNCSFRSKNISGQLLKNILNKIKEHFSTNNTYLSVTSNDNIEEKFLLLNKNVKSKEIDYEVIIFKTRSDMSDTEAIYYYIRNALAHGDFEIKNKINSYVYLLESKKKNDIKAWMRLDEKTLLEFIKYTKYTSKQIQEMKKSKKKSTYNY